MSMVSLQPGHVTGADSMVAAFSISGAMNTLPQCGQVTGINPLSIVPEINPAIKLFSDYLANHQSRPDNSLSGFRYGGRPLGGNHF